MTSREQIVTDTARKLIDYAIPIFVQKPNDQLEPIGTGFTLSLNEKLFFVTAHHCILSIQEFNKSIAKPGAIILGINGAVHALNRPINFVFTNDDPTKPAHTLDISTFEIHQSDSFFEDAYSIAIDESYIPIEYFPSNFVTVAGYAIKDNKLPIKRTMGNEPELNVKEQLYVQYLIEPNFDLESINRYPIAHCAIDWPRKDTNGNSTPVPRGISGAPVWCFSDPTCIESRKLVGIFTEFYEKHKLAVFTKSDMIPLLLDNHYMTNS